MVAIGGVIAAFGCAIIAGSSGRNPFGWGLVGLFFSISTLVVGTIPPAAGAIRAPP